MIQKYCNDPLMEEKCEVVKGLVWKYPKRVLLELTLACNSYCKFCTRKRKVNDNNKYYLTKEELDNILSYIKKHKDINEVIISGGDPVVVPDYLLYVLKKLNDIKNIKVIRIHTKSPELIKNEVLAQIKNQNSPVYLGIHINKASEINTETLKKMKKAGFILFSQSVFIKGLNDEIEILVELFTKLIENGVRPYYIYHCDNVSGFQQFQVSIKKEKEIMKEVRNKISGLACPFHVKDCEKEKVIL